jgi:hypothetical protein
VNAEELDVFAATGQAPQFVDGAVRKLQEVAISCDHKTCRSFQAILTTVLHPFFQVECTLRTAIAEDASWVFGAMRQCTALANAVAGVSDPLFTLQRTCGMLPRYEMHANKLSPFLPLAICLPISTLLSR